MLCQIGVLLSLCILVKIDFISSHDILLFILIVLETIIYLTRIFIKLVIAPSTFLFERWSIASIILVILVFIGELDIRPVLFVWSTSTFSVTLYLLIKLWLLHSICLMETNFSIFIGFVVFFVQLCLYLSTFLYWWMLDLIIFYVEYVVIFFCRDFTIWTTVFWAFVSLLLFGFLKEGLILILLWLSNYCLGIDWWLFW